MNESNSRMRTLAEAPVLRAIFTMAMPVMLGMIVQVLYNLVDTFFIGMMGNVNQLAAANVGFPLFMIMMAVGSIIGVGASSVISRYLGMKKAREAGEIIGLSAYLVVAIAAVFTAALLIFFNPVITLLGAKGNVVVPTGEYLFPLIAGSAVIMANFAFGVTLRAEGAAMQTMAGMLIGSVVNIILDPVMIFACGLGIAGAAWATVIGNLAGLLWYVRCYAKTSVLKVTFGSHVWNAEYLREIFSIGIPSGINQGLMSVAGIFSNNLVALYGVSSLAAIGIAQKVNSMVILLLVGLATGCQPLIGYNYGARNKKRLVSVLKTSMGIAAILGTTMLGIFALTGRLIISLFTSDPTVIDQGRYILTALSSAAPIIGIIMIVMNCLQAIGKPIPSLILSTGRQGLYYIPILFLLNALFGFDGLVWTQPIVDVLMVITATIMLAHVIRTDPILHGELVA